MALPGDVSTFTISFGHAVEGYTDATGSVALLGKKGKLYPVDVVTGKRINLVHIASGQAILPTDVEIVLEDDGKAKATVGPLPHTDNPGLSVVGFGYHVEWNIPSGSHSATPKDKTFAAPAVVGATVDYDLLDSAQSVPGVLVPVGTGPQGPAGPTGPQGPPGQDGAGTVASVNGKAGVVVLSAADVGAQPAGSYATAADLTDGLATKVNSSTYTAGLATKADAADLAAKAPYRANVFTPPTAQVRVVSTMDSGWTALDQGTAVHDSTIFDTGTGSLKMTAPSTTGDKVSARLTFTAQDWSDQAFSFRFRTDAWSNIIDAYLLASTSGSFAQFYRVQLTPSMARVVNNEWSEITFTRSDFTFNSGTANWATVNGLIFQVYSAAGTTPSLWLDQFVRYTAPSRPTISFAFDDGFAPTATVAAPALDKYGYRLSAYVMPTAIGTAGYLTQGQVDALAAAGHEIGGHGVTDLTTLSFAAAEADVAATKKYLVDRGYKGSDVYAYPLGGQNVALRAMVAKYFGAARGTAMFGQTRNYLARRCMMTRQLGPAITLAAAKAWVDTAVANNDWLIITGHNLRSPTVTAEDWTPADFAALVDYVGASGAQVLPVAEALAQADTAANGLVLTAPNGTKYRFTVGNDGALTTVVA